VHAQYYIVIVACSAVPYFPTLSHKWIDFWEKKIIEPTVRLLTLYTNLSEMFLVLKVFIEILQYIYIDILVKYPLLLSYLKKT
jgi:hypothetical protein